MKLSLVTQKQSHAAHTAYRTITRQPFAQEILIALTLVIFPLRCPGKPQCPPGTRTTCHLPPRWRSVGALMRADASSSDANTAMLALPATAPTQLFHAPRGYLIRPWAGVVHLREPRQKLAPPSNASDQLNKHSISHYR